MADFIDSLFGTGEQVAESGAMGTIGAGIGGIGDGAGAGVESAAGSSGASGVGSATSGAGAASGGGGGMDWASTIIGGAGVLGNVMGNQQTSRDRKDALKQQQAMLDYIKGIQNPDLKAQVLEQYAASQDFTPEQVQALQQERSSLADFSTDPATQQAQRDALAQLTAMSSGGLTAADRAAIQDYQMQAAQADRGNQQAIMSNMAERGMAGGGQELAARLSSSQGAANRAAADSRNAVQGAQQRALQAIVQSGQLAGNMRGQEFSEAERRAQAQDAINRFNTGNMQGVQGTNVAARNQANMQNLVNRQNVNNQNTDIRNINAGAQNVLAQQQFGNTMAKANAMTGTSNNMATNQMTAANQAGRDRANIVASGVGFAKDAYGAYSEPDEFHSKTVKKRGGYEG